MLNLTQINERKKGNELRPAFFSDEFSFNWGDYSNLVANNLSEILNNEVISSDIERIIVISENNWQTFILYSVISSLGIPFSGIDYSQSEEIKLANIKNSGSNLVLYSAAHAPSKAFEELLQKNHIYFHDINSLIQLNVKSGNEAVEELLKNFKKNRSHEISSFSFTSGTSGIPKVIYRTSGFDGIRIPILTKLYHFNREDIFLATLPFSHVSVTGWIRLSLMNGGAVVVADIEDSKDVYAKLIDYKVTTSLFTPPVLRKIVDIAKKNRDKTDLRFIMVGGKTFPVSLKEEAITTFGPIIHEYYGSSETGINALISSPEYLKKTESSGKAMEGSELLIVDNDYQKLKDGKIGRIAVSSFQNAAGYLHSELERTMIDGKDFIITSDFGKMEDGYLSVTQREILEDCNQTIDAFELENNIRLFRQIRDVAVLTKNKKVNIFVTFEKNASELSKKIVRHAVSEYISGALDASISFTLEERSQINYSLSGKVKYFKLKKKQSSCVGAAQGRE
ncbi:hypothetical protein OfM1_06630 [Lactovum odontotermitis]